MEQNPELSFAWQFVANTGTHLFLTGRAGTGKTTFLHRLKSEAVKRMVVVAPTGIAAINAGGVTIHSFFQLPLAPYVPGNSFAAADARSAYRFRFSKEKINIIRSIDLLVIDEISMVRADLLDAVDQVLRQYRDRGKPFGGVQLLLIGDLQQLAPVVKDNEWSLLKGYYETPYFFSSWALKQTEYCVIELTRVYRQADSRFLDLLNSIRENRCGPQVMRALNSRYMPHFHPDKKDGYIRLVTHNAQAQRINDQELQMLPGRIYPFRATIEGKFPDYMYPTDLVLELKEGTQVMFVKNDSTGNRRYYNGMIGEVVSVSQGRIEVRPHGSDKTLVLNEETWNNAKYTLNGETKELTEEIEGSFKQYPLKPAWAITVHKSQGLTFEHAIIDVSASFAHGQAYVALSRCKTLEGLVLSRPLSEDAIISDDLVDAFMRQAHDSVPDAARFRSLRQAYYHGLLAELFDFQPVEQALHRYVRLIDEFLYKLHPRSLAAYKAETVRINERVTQVSQKFSLQYTRLLNASADCDADAVLQERVRKGAAYFREQLSPLDALLSATVLGSDNKELKKRLSAAYDELAGLLEQKRSLLGFVSEEGFHVAAYLKHKAILAIESDSPKPKKAKTAVPETVSSDVLHPGLYSRLVKWRNAMAAERGVPAYAVIQQKALLGISNVLPDSKPALLSISCFGKKSVEKYGDIILEMIRDYKAELR